VIAQVALSTLLLVGTGLVVHTAVNLRGFDLGFDPDGALRFAIDPRIQGYDDAEVAELVTVARQRLTAVAGVQAAGFAAPELVSDSYFTYAVRAEGATEDELVLAGQVQVSAGLLEALGARLDAGRLFRDQDMDTAAARTPVVVSRSLVTSAFGDQSYEAAIGRTLLVPGGRAARSLEIVGVIEDPHFGGALGRDAPRVFLPWAGGFDFPLTAWVRAPGAPSRVTAEVRRTMQEVDPERPVYDLRTGRAQPDRIIVEQRVVARLALGLALVGLLLAGVELHGVLAYTVEQRRHEIGVRVALGAAPGTILGRFVGRGITLALVGAALGAGGAYWLTQFIRARLFGVQPLDPLTYLFGLAALVITAAVASWGPARRSLSVSPREALEAE
jgi:putative ABC transport system permease protein